MISTRFQRAKSLPDPLDDGRERASAKMTPSIPKTSWDAAPWMTTNAHDAPTFPEREPDALRRRSPTSSLPM
jgi:hypothetical protein